MVIFVIATQSLRGNDKGLKGQQRPSSRLTKSWFRAFHQELRQSPLCMPGIPANYVGGIVRPTNFSALRF